MRFFLILILCLFSAQSITPAMAQENTNLSYKTFEQLPILDKGRIKPIGAFAKARLKDFAGTDKAATQWLAETLFNPSEAITAKIFLIRSNALKTRLGLDANIDNFNIADLQNGLQATQSDVIALLNDEEAELTAEQDALLKIHEDVISYNELLRSFSLILPLNNDSTFLELLPQEQRITGDLKSIIAEKGEDISIYTEAEQKTALMGFQLQQIRSGGNGNNDLKVIPSKLGEDITWVAPWQTINDGQGSPQTKEIILLWAEMANAYRGNDLEKWNAASQKILNETLSITKISHTRLKTELLYQNLKPYHLAMASYTLGILLLLIMLSRPSKAIAAAALIALSGASVFHASGIAARIYILDRPPVGTLYESVLFVSLICAIIGLIVLAKTRKPILPLTAQVAALGLLAIAPTMLQNNDSLELLVAVLNTNFWLATHVLCITAGYGFCILAACLAHTYMILRAKNPSHVLLGGILKSIHKIGMISLLLTSVGTVLGGIWADQSWGRFWGWDPKENGALLIVLWLIWIQHGRLSGHIRPLGYVAGMAALNIIVALAWFGVNLLGVGLHSYGFTSGIASGLAIFCIAETIIILMLWITIRMREKKQEKTS